MKPMEIAKAVYQVFGTPYPRLSLGAVALLGAISFAAVWLFLAKQVEKDRAAAPIPPAMTGPATAGNGSVANTGNGNTITNDSSDRKGKKE